MSAQPLVLACQLEDLKQLDSKPFEKYPRGLIRAVQERMPRCYQPTFQHLFDESLKNYRDKGRVRKSIKELAEAMKYHTRTADRHLSYLREAGFIRVLKGDGNGVYKKNYIEVVCPKDILQSLLALQDRTTRNNTVYKPTTLMSCADDIGVAHSFNNRCKIENTNVNNREVNLSTGSDAAVTESDNLSIVDFKNCCSSTVESPKHLLPNQTNSNNQSEIFSACKLVKYDNSVGFVSKAERIEVVKKIKGMNKSQEIHSTVLSHGKTIENLIQEVVFHCIYRDRIKVPTFKHALNFAAKAIRNGTWTTPKRLVQMEIDRREAEDKAWKEKERKDRAMANEKLSEIKALLLKKISPRQEYSQVKTQDNYLNKSFLVSELIKGMIQRLDHAPTEVEYHAIQSHAEAAADKYLKSKLESLESGGAYNGKS